MTDTTLGKLEAVDLRSIWSDEARDFTPWLAEHLDELGAALRLDLQLTETEAAVGSFAIDVLAEAEDGVVVIENQLERTDHSHLGQLLTYAAGRDARVLIWITPEFRDEHRAALDWLNRWTSEEISAYGVEARLVRIGDSLPAPEFRAVAFPNDWSRQGRSPAGDTGLSGEEKDRRIRFFDDLTRLAHSDGLTNATSSGSVARSKSFPCRVNKKGVIYWVDWHRNGRLDVQLLVNCESTELNARIMEGLMSVQDDFSQTLGFEPEWRTPNPDGPRRRKSGIVRARRSLSISDPPERRQEAMDWCVDFLKASRQVLEPRIAEILGYLDSEELDGVDAGLAGDSVD